MGAAEAKGQIRRDGPPEMAFRSLGAPPPRGVRLACSLLKWQGQASGAVLEQGAISKMQVPSRGARWATTIALFLGVFSARLLLIAAFGHPLPFADEWDAGAAGLYRPYVAGELSLRHLLSPHNEHRFLTSRVLGLIEFELAGGWNLRFQMLVNAALAAGLATWLANLLMPMVSEQRRLGLALFTAIAFALPIDVEVSLMGMNAHFYLMIIFSIAALLAFTRGPALGPRWWSGVLWSALAFLSTASAALTPLVALVVVVMQGAVGARRFGWKEIVAGALLIAGTALMLAYVPAIEGHVRYRAQSVWQFLDALVALGAIPLITPLGLAFVQAPVFAHVWNTVRARLPWQHPAWIAVAIAGWVASQIVSISYSRALYPLSSRYLDIVLLALPIGAAALLSMAGKKKRVRLFGAVWLFAVCTTMSAEAFLGPLRTAGEMRETLEREQSVVTTFLATGDPGDILAGKAKLSYPDPQRLIRALSDPVIRTIIPEPIQPPDAGPTLARDRLFLRGGMKAQIDTITAFLDPIAKILAAVAIGLWVLAGYQNAMASRSDGRQTVAERDDGGTRPAGHGPSRDRIMDLLSLRWRARREKPDG